MEKMIFRNYAGDIACISETTDNRILLVLKNKAGTVLKEKPYKSIKGAKTALGMAGPWIGFNPQR